MKDKSPVAFTVSELEFVQEAFHLLGFEGVVPYLDSYEAENDAIVCANGFSIQKFEEVTASLSGTAVYRPVYVVSETYTYPATRNEPETGDFHEFATVGSVAEAAKAVVLRNYEYEVDGALESVSISRAYGVEEL